MRPFLTSSVAVFTLTLFASATLLFLIEPMIAKMILPKFGGTPAVWNTCMVFFQAALLAGYAYAHAVTTWLPPRRQTIVQLVLLALPILLVLPIRVEESWAPKAEDYPVVWLLWLLMFTVGLPFFVISTSAPLLSKWFSSTGDTAARDPYFLYAASNVGSMVSLFGYPLLVEPVFSLRWQSWLWEAGYLGLVALTAWCTTRVWRATAPSIALATPDGAVVTAEAEEEDEEDGKSGVAVKKKKRKRRKGGKDDAEAITTTPAEQIAPPIDDIPAPEAPDLEAGTRPTVRRYLYWTALAFVPSSMMLAVTTYLTTDIASIPLLWVIPLGLYLLSFILVFSKWTTVENWFWVDLTRLLLGRAGRSYSQNAINKARSLGMHGFMILALPVAVLLLVFLMVSDIRIGWIGWAFLLHLSALFIVSMVCHGELARTRPPTSYLTGYYLCMSFGGVIGGLFNALAAPLIFSSVAEYPIVLVIACLLVPALETGPTSRVNFWIDIGLAVALGVGAAYALARFFIGESATQSWEGQAGTPGLETAVSVTAVVLGLMVYAALSKSDRLGRWLDVGLPVALAILSAQLFFRSPFRFWDLKSLSESFGMKESRMVDVLTFGLPVALCYGFAERPIRFGLGVGAIFLAGAINSGLHKEDDVERFNEYTFYDHLLDGKEFPRDSEGYILGVTFTLHQERSFFGVLKVEHRVPGNYVRLLHGTTLHGEQRRNSMMAEVRSAAAPVGVLDPLAAVVNAYSGQELLALSRDEPLTYYHRTGPIGEVYRTLCPPAKQCEVAFIGLGTGTMASYLEPGQHGDIYDIDPAVVRLASDPQYFTYLHDCRGKYDIRLGDARLKMRDARDENGALKKYRLIVVDAFSSDAIPVHLITKEAIEMYFQHLEPDGILAIHISNRHLNLGPVLGKIADAIGKTAVGKYDKGADVPWRSTPGKNTSDWVVMAHQPASLEALFKEDEAQARRWDDGVRNAKEAKIDVPDRLVTAPRWRPIEVKTSQPVWTDDFSNIIGVLNWWD